MNEWVPSVEVSTPWLCGEVAQKCATARLPSFGSNTTWNECSPVATSVQVAPPSVERAIPPGRRDARRMFGFVGDTAMRVTWSQPAVDGSWLHVVPPSVDFITPAPRTKWLKLRTR